MSSDKIVGGSAVQGATNECRQLEFDPLWHLKPVKVEQRLCDVVIVHGEHQRSKARRGSGVQHGLETTKLAGAGKPANATLP